MHFFARNEMLRLILVDFQTAFLQNLVTSKNFSIGWNSISADIIFHQKKSPLHNTQKGQIDPAIYQPRSAQMNYWRTVIPHAMT